MQNPHEITHDPLTKKRSTKSQMESKQFPLSSHPHSPLPLGSEIWDFYIVTEIEIRIRNLILMRILISIRVFSQIKHLLRVECVASTKVAPVEERGVCVCV